LISGLIEITVRKTLPLNSVYLPASRTGFLQTYKSLSNDAIMSNFSNKKNEEKHTLSVIVRFFITQLNTATSFEENKFAEFIENFIMNGKVDIYKDSNEIDFKLKDGSKINLNYLSSTVSELIPLVVFLKRGLIKKDGLLVIEEPEAHLSFKNQKLVAKLIATLLQNKIKVLITTHSDFLIYEFNNLIMRNEILKNKGKLSDVEFNFDDKVAIDYRKVSLYNFILNNDKSRISRIKINRSGIQSKYIFDSTYSVTKEKNKLLDILDNIDANNF
jgi:predicted ATPase